QKAKIPEFESEPGLTSDTKSKNPGVRVRTRVNFRHKKRKSGSLSPNLDQLQTQKAKIREFESELGSTSDTKSENPGVRVRTWINFQIQMVAMSSAKSKINAFTPQLCLILDRTIIPLADML
ncbi:hypothetical protein, partial [Cytobacillus firmus]|uniref:hypothetical protein n=1 Tax=Cytobacillus firmus TaxID=1399 RepID=UPI00064EA691